ncbi:Hsp33 family molecular chaperone HslO [Cetobacterium somerae]|uniref:Hsp33 family molecular chaperone HslO n=1 Tax=Cetobacterium sp. NK01 TaxID=2993530 RepID=UPI0021160A95|nr:Hsp33 family molecular chaperone HslO [Cetobacterium sp. NK01]MCQ8211994.1 Hsp33 family molecular chaperone HslO [Cetobacterium sp. NK01]
MSRLIRGVSKNARFVLVDAKDIVQEALNIHKCSPTAISAFGRLLSAGVMMGATLKGNDILTLRTVTDGPLSSMVVTVDKDGVKGYVSNPEADLPAKENGQPDVQALVGRGTLNVIKDLGLKDPYVGVSTIESGEIAYDIAYYYVTSEQTPTVIALGVDLENETTVRSAGGYMIQLLPDAEEDFIVELEKKIGAIRSVTELFKGGMDLERILHLLYEDMNDETHEKLIESYEILDSKEIKYNCNCDKEKFYKGIITLGKEQLEEILAERGEVEAECHFCGKRYSFKREDLGEIL